MGRDDPVGDLARDAAEDVRRGCLSRWPATAVGLRRHLRRRHPEAIDRALDALDRAAAEHAAAVTR